MEAKNNSNDVCNRVTQSKFNVNVLICQVHSHELNMKEHSEGQLTLYDYMQH